MSCIVALSQPCGEWASAKAQAAAIAMILPKPREGVAMVGVTAIARPKAMADAMKTAVEPSQLLVAGTEESEGTRYGCFPIIVPTGSPIASPKPVTRYPEIASTPKRMLLRRPPISVAKYGTRMKNV